MENKKVIGVLKYNIETRNSMLLKNEGKYSQYDGLLSPSIGEAYQQKTLYPHSQTNDKSILDFTHDNEGDYSKKIAHQYFSNSKDRDVFSILAPTNDQLQRWGGNYNNYLDYVSKTYGKELTSVNFVERTLAAQDVIYGLRMMEVGVVKDISVSNALAGVVTTNINNFSGTDTKLGLITNEMYAASLYAASQFNSSRKRYDTTSQYPYITPSLYKFYGNNSANINRLSDIMRPDVKTGRVKEDPTIDINIVHDWNDKESIIADNSSFTHAWAQTRGNKYTPDSAYYKYNRDSKNFEESYNDNAIKDLNRDISIINLSEDKTNIAHVAVVEYDEGDKAEDVKGGKRLIEGNNGSQENEYFTFEAVQKNSKNTLLDKTNKAFRKHEINTLISRFHTSEKEYNNKYKNESFDTAKSPFGKSKGRNLLKLGANSTEYNFKTNNYSNPYCRVWTYHHAYDRLSRMIRPFITEDNGKENPYGLAELQKLNENFRAKGLKNATDGWDYLAEKTVINNSNGLVNIAPSSEGKVDIKKCMFSIENLAWKDVPNMSQYLSEEQRGPFGGRIMWFPPYDLSFQESVNVNWNSNTFIGRGEKVYTYTDTDRTATLNFTILIDHPAIVNEIRNMEGKKPDNDIEMDTLRFFAGCGPLDNDKKKPQDTNKDITVSKEESTEPVEAENEEKAEKLKFYVFFPNNYSGNYNDGKLMTLKEWENRNFADSDWLTYLLFGKDISVPDNSGEYLGYEMGKGSGISTKEGNTITTAVDPSTNVSKNWTVFPEYEGEDKEKRKYHYRVDFDLRQKLYNLNNYYDAKDFNLNISRDDVRKIHSDADCSLVEFVAAMSLKRARENAKNVNGVDNYDYEYFSTEDADKNVYLRRLLEKLTKYYGDDEINAFDAITELAQKMEKGVKKIMPIGGATEQDKKNSNLLAFRRCRTVGAYFKNKLKFEGEVNYYQIEDTGQLLNDKTVNSIAAKAERYASVEVYFGTPEKNDANKVLGTEGNSIQEEKTGITQTSGATEVTGATKQEVHAVVGNAATRYESEAEYFDKLQTSDPLIFKKITDKYKYFDPAFHSLSPEGFNARLTFLHQCTRQGHTVSTADGKTAKTAGNLSFGRMPVCILRLGDFLYSKVLVQSMTIDYKNGNGVQWDLNPEGNGVQPMYASVSMSLVILGGQTLDGPSDRLQNANTFNFYANTGVYDDRADRISVDSNGNLRYENVFLPYNDEEKTTVETVEQKQK